MSLQTVFSSFTQDTRLLQLTTPLGRDRLIAETVHGEEGLGEGFRIQLSALSTDAHIPLKSLIGQPALLQLLTAQSRDQRRPFHGHITKAQFIGANGGLARYQLTLEPWMAFMALGRDSRIFQRMSVFDILSAVFSTWKGKGNLSPAWRFDIADRDAYPVRSLTTQYQESDLAFTSRLMLEEGLFHYFEHTGTPDSPSLGGHTMVIADHNGSFRPNAQPDIRFSRASDDSLDRWQTHTRHLSNAVEVNSWDYRSPDTRPISANHWSEVGMLTACHAMGSYAYGDRDHGQRIAENMLNALDACRDTHSAEGTVRTLEPGTSFTLRGHAVHDRAPDDQARTFVITRAVHRMNNNLSADVKAEVASRLPPCTLDASGERPVYRIRIEAIALGVRYRPNPCDEHGMPRWQRPTVHGQLTAIVVGPPGSVIHTDRDHRIKVQFHWARGIRSHSRLADPSPDTHAGAPGDDSAGTWVRVATSMAPTAGANWGANALPRVGQEVLVDFMDGDIDRPVVIGCLYNGRGQQNTQYNTVPLGAGPSTGNAPAWFPGTSAAHAHPPVLSGYKSQAMESSQRGNGAYSQLVFDSTNEQARVSLQRHSVVYKETDQLNLGSLRHQINNQRLAPSGFGAELLTTGSVAVRGGKGLLLSASGRGDATGSHLDAGEAQGQIAQSLELQKALAEAAQKHGAVLPDGGKSGPLAAIAQSEHSLKIISGADETKAYSQPHLQASAPAGIVAVTPADAVLCAGGTGSISAQDAIDVAAMGNTVQAVVAGISLFTYGQAGGNNGVKLHAASGKLSSQSQSDATRFTADKTITVASVTKGVKVAAKSHLLLTAAGGALKIEGGNITLQCSGTVEFKASMKELEGPKDATQSFALPPVGKFVACPAKLDAAGSGGGAAI